MEKFPYLSNKISTESGSGEAMLLKGEPVVVIGASPRRGHLVVEKKNHTIHVPFQFLELRTSISG